MSEQGICSRREADNYIEQGLGLVDGEVVSELGARAFPNQKIELKKAAIHNKLVATPSFSINQLGISLTSMKTENTNLLPL